MRMIWCLTSHDKLPEHLNNLGQLVPISFHPFSRISKLKEKASIAWKIPSLLQQSLLSMLNSKNIIFFQQDFHN